MIKNNASIHILFLAAIPSDIPPLNVAAECRVIDQALRIGEFRDYFDLQDHWATQIFDLQELLMRHKPHIVHFSGHGSLSNELIFQDSNGKACPLSPEVLSGLFALLKDNIQCVILNACYSERQALAIAKHISCVIGMPDVISDDAAIKFSAAFYRAVGFGRDMQTAFELSCLEIESDLSGLAEHLKPQLLSPNCDPRTVFTLPLQATQCQQRTKKRRGKTVTLPSVNPLKQNGQEEDWFLVR